MTKANELTTPVRNGRNNFRLVGKVRLDGFSFKKDIISDNSGFKYNSCYIGVNVSPGFNVYCESMGGFFPNNKDNKGKPRENILYRNDKNNPKQQIHIDFKDRLDKDIIDTVSGFGIHNVSIVHELDEDGESTDTVERKQFLSEYDMIDYLERNLYDGQEVAITGNIEYSVYNGEIQTRRRIQNVYLKRDEEENKATFIQTILLNRDSISKPKDGEIEIFAQVPSYVGKIGSKVVRKILALPQMYSMEDTETTRKMASKFMKAKRNRITEITMEGEYKSSVQVGEVTQDELSPDMVELVEMGLFTMEDALEKQNEVIKGDRGKEIQLLKRPHIKQGAEDGVVIINYTLDKYDDTDLLTHFMFSDDEDDVATMEQAVVDEVMEDGDSVIDVDDASWLNDL